VNRNLVAAAVLGLALGSAYAWLQSQAPDPLAADAVAEECRPTGTPCTLAADGGEVTLTLPATVRTLQAFDLHVETAGFREVVGVVVRFDMTGMDMGENRYPLKAEGEAEGGTGIWSTEAMLPVCTADRVDWFAEVTVRHAAGVTRFAFPFEVGER
jgi:hypothetical protein